MVNFYKKRIFIVLVIFSMFGFNLLAMPVEVKAEGAGDSFQGSLNEAGGAVGYDIDEPDENVDTKEKIAKIVGTSIAVIISFIGLIFFVLMFMGAIEIIGAGGDDEKVLAGKKQIKNGAIGILIVFIAYMLSSLLLALVTGNLSDNPIFKL